MNIPHLTFFAAIAALPLMAAAADIVVVAPAHVASVADDIGYFDGGAPGAAVRYLTVNWTAGNQASAGLLQFEVERGPRFPAGAHALPCAGVAEHPKLRSPHFIELVEDGKASFPPLASPTSRPMAAPSAGTPFSSL